MLEWFSIQIPVNFEIFKLYSVKKRPEIPILSTFINNEILQNFKGKNHGLVLEILEESLYLSKALLL